MYKRTKLDIRRAIKEHGYSVRDFSEKMGFTPANLSQIINGNPTVKKLTEICEVLECDMTDLFYPINEPSVDGVVVQTNDKEKKNGNAATAPSTGEQPAPPSLQATTFCPHCGAKVRVGVVLLAE